MIHAPIRRRRPIERPKPALTAAIRALWDRSSQTPEQRNLAIVRYDAAFAEFQRQHPPDEFEMRFARMRLASAPLR